MLNDKYYKFINNNNINKNFKCYEPNFFVECSDEEVNESEEEEEDEDEEGKEEEMVCMI